MSAQSKVLRLALAVAMLTATPVVDAQTMVCGPNGCRMVQGQPVRNVVRYAAAPVARVVTAPARVVRYGPFGRARYSVQPQATQSYGSTGGYSQSYGSSGGTATYEASSGSNGGLGSYGDGPTQPRATAAPVTTEAPAASVPLTRCKCGDDCQCVDCDCQTQVCTVPAFAPTKRLCVVPPTSVSATCRVPACGPSVEAVASL